MKLTEREDNGVTILELRGAFVGEYPEMVLDAAVHRLCRLGATRVVIDLSRVHAVDLLGLQALHNADRAFRRIGARCALAGVTARLDDLVVITRLLMVFDTHVTTEDAIGAMPWPAVSGATASLALHATRGMLTGA